MHLNIVGQPEVGMLVSKALMVFSEYNIMFHEISLTALLFKLISGRSSKMVELESSTSKVAQLQIGE